MYVSLAIAMTAAEVTQPNRKFESVDDSAEAEVVFQTQVEHDNYSPREIGQDDPQTDEIQIQVEMELDEWTPRMEKKFRALVVAGALGRLDTGGLQELRTLQRDRRNLTNRRPMEEIIEEARMQRVTDDLLRAFDNYVQQRQASAWRDAKEVFHESSEG